MGSKKGGGARTPYEAPNTLNSAQNLRIIDALCEGEIAGFANGNDAPYKSIYFDDTPVQNPDNSFNFNGVMGFFQVGTPDQSYIPNFEATERVVSVGANVKHNTPIIRAISDSQINRLRVTVGVERNVQIQENGDSIAANTQLVVELLNNSGVHIAKNVDFTEKSSGAFYHDIVFDTLPAVPFNLRVRRVTPDSTNDKTANNTFFASFVEIIDVKMSYPHTALAALKIDSDQFGNQIPRRNYLIKGKLVQVPSNYDPEKRQYSGSLWDGSFKMAWSNNPAWVFYDLLTNPRYSTLAKRLTTNDIDKWALYQVAKYCDELVPDGFGGQEPRFVCNAYITDLRQAADLLNDLASVFCGLAVWNGNQISVLQDKHTDPVAVYSNANVLNGQFDYAGAQMKAIHTAVHVKYADKHDGYRSKVEYISDNQAISRYGLNIKQITAFGCDSRGQAARFGSWVLETELRQQHTVTFTIGREGLKHLPYDIIRIADNHYAGAEISGRIVAVTGNQITFDRDVQNATGAVLFYTDTISGSLKSVKITRQINGKSVQTETAINARVDDVWVMSGRVKPRLYRAMSVKENTNDGTYTITALLHDAEKYGVVDESAVFDHAVNTLHNSVPELHNAAISTENGGLRVSWDNLATDGDVLDYDIKLFRNNVLYHRIPNHDTPEIAFGNLPSGDYRVEIRGRNARGVYSSPLIKAFQINYTINGLRANSKTLAVELIWTLPEIITVKAHTEIWYATSQNFQAERKLASLPIPQNSYTLTGVAVIDRFWFWVRLVDENGNFGEFTPFVVGQADPNPAPIVSQIQGAITKSTLSQALIAQLQADDIAAENRAKIAAATDAANKVAAEANARATAIQAAANQQATNLRNETNRLSAAIANASSQAQTALNAKAAELTAQAAQLGNRVREIETVNTQQAQAIQSVTAAQNSTAAALENERTARANAIRAETTARETLAAKMDNLQVGGRNLLLKSNVGRTTLGTTTYAISPNVELSTIRELVLSVDVDVENFTTTGGKLPRIGAEIQVFYDEAGSEYKWFGAWLIATTTPQTLKKRLIAKLTIPSDKTIAKLTYNKVQINNARFDRAEVKNIKLETGNTATDWTPAPEDNETAISDVQAALTSERNARTEAQRAEAAERQALATKVSQNTAALTAERAARNDAIRAETVARETQIAKFQVADTRRDNQPPSWYWDNYPKQTAKEFKLLNVLGLPVNGMGLLETNVQWQNASGGKIEQKLTDPNGKVWRRLSDTTHTYANGVYTYTKDAWTAWVADETEAGAQAKADAVRQIAEATQRNLTATQAELAAYKTSQATAEQAQTAEIQAAKSRLNAAESNINNLQRTTSTAQRALSEAQNTLTARLDNLQVGGRNLLRNSNRAYNSAAYSTRYELTEAPSVGDDVVITLWGEIGSDRTGIGVYNSHGYSSIANLQKIADGVYRGFGRWRKPMNGATEVTPNDTHLNVYFYPNNGTTSNIINQIKLEKGNIGTDWSPAPEDTQAATDIVQAELTAYKSAQATTDAVQTAEIQAAKSQMAQNKATIEQIRTSKADKTEVLGLVRTTLQSEWRSDVAAAESRAKADAQRLNTATTAKITALEQSVANQNSATATRLDTLSASLNNMAVGGRNLLLKSNVGRTTLGTSRYDITSNFDLSTIDELVLSVDIDVANFVSNGGNLPRIGAEIQVFFDDAGADYRWFGAWLPATTTAQTTKTRLVAKLKIPDGKRIAKLTYNKVQINSVVFDRAEVKNIKLEVGNVATAWTPAPEDAQSFADSVQAELTAYKSAQATTDAAQTAEIQATKSQMAQNKATIEQMRTSKADKTEVLGLVRTTLQSEWRNDVNAAKNQAATDAQAKAEAAKQAAITAADTAATTKANAAKAAAIAEATNTATAKAEAAKAVAIAEAAAKDAVLKQQSAADAQTKADSAKNAAIAEANRLNTATTAKITALEQSVANQNSATATRLDTLSASLNNMAVGGRNLLKNSAQRYEGAQYSTRYELIEAPTVGDDVVVTVWGELGSERTGIGAYNSHGFDEVVHLQKIADGIYRGVGKWKKPMRNNAEITPNDTHLNVYFYPRTATSSNVINKIKLEKGNIGTDWSPAPEDTQAATDIVQAELTAYKSAQATADQAQTNEINAAKSRLGTAESSIRTVQTTLTGLNGKVQSMYSLKVQSVGSRKAVAGLVLGADGQTGDSQVLIYADKFALVQPNTNAIKSPFVVTTVNGQTKMALSGDMIVDGVIHGRHIAAGQTLQAPNIQGGSLNIGNGRFVVDGNGQVAISSQHGNVGLKMNNDQIVVYDEHGRAVCILGRM